jgi:hypothetical protein
MKDDRPKPLHNRKTSRSETYERNGWIGLAVTLAVCVPLALLKFGCVAGL